ncbi:hypothetical protein ACFL3B_02755 [Gemmatimonadota bacterium]
MISARGVSFRFSGLSAVAALLLATSCSDGDFAAPSVTGILLKPAAAAVKVNETDPIGAPQETTLDVQVFGSGFDDGSEVTFMLDGLPNPKVSTNSSHYVSPDTLVANITVAVDADTVLYDVEVLTTRGKKGIGVDLFRVVEKGQTVGDTPITVEFSDADGDRVKSDDGDVYAGIFREDPNGSLIFSTLDGSRNETRQLCFDFPQDPEHPLLPSDGCLDALLTTAYPEGEGNPGGMPAMEPGGSLKTSGQFIWSSVEVINGKPTPVEWFLRYGPGGCLFEEVVEANQFTVTRGLVPYDDEWVLEGQDAYLCRNLQQGKPQDPNLGEFQMPFNLTLKLVTP